MATLKFHTLDAPSPKFLGLLALNAVVVALGLGSALYMETNGHVVTGMNDQIVWGMPHVFAVFLIVAASGALNVASMSSVFGRLAYKPYARLSGALAISLLAGGLAVLVLDLGRPERLIIAMTTYNFKSIFAWNMYLYTGFVAVVAIYLFSMMDRQASKSAGFVKVMGLIAFVLRLALTTGTGSIFGFLVAREAYDAALEAPLFIAASFLYGLAFTVLVLAVTSSQTREDLVNEEMVGKFRGLFYIFAFSVLYFTILLHLSKLYASAHQGIEAFILLDGGVYTLTFWVGQIAIGTLAPIALLYFGGEGAAGRRSLTIASVLFIVGGLAQMFVVIVGGEAYPLDLFPGVAVSSSFYDGVVTVYHPSLPEILLGLSGISISMLVVALALRLLPFLPRAQAQ